MISGYSCSNGNNSIANTAAQVPIPDAALVAVLQHIELQERLGNCALVCRSWNAAAAAATSNSQFTVTQYSASSLQWWIYRHVQQFTSVIDIAAANTTTTTRSGYLTLPGLPFTTTQGRLIEFQLPLLQLAQLQCMHLSGLQLAWRAGLAAAAEAVDASAVAAAMAEAEALEAAAAAGAELCSTAASLAALTGLTALKLHNAKLCCCRRGVCGLWSLTSLQQLSLSHEGARVCESVNMLLPYLTSLTSLALMQNEDRTGFSEVSRLVNLQSLQLQLHPAVAKSLNPPNLVTAPASLTRLEILSSSIQGDEISRQSVLGLESCTALQHLSLQLVGEVEIAALGQLRQLTWLDIQVHAFDRQHLAGMFIVLQGMQQLRYLRIHRLSKMRGWDWSAKAAAVAEHTVKQNCTALMSLGQLTHLDMLNIPWAEGVTGGHLFRAEKQLSNLVSLTLGWSEIDFRLDEFGGSYVELFDSEGLARLTSCCPALQQLDLCEEVHGAANLSSLLQLSHLTQLTLGGEQICNSTLEQLVHFSSLQSLAVNPVSTLSVSGRYPRSNPMFDDAGLHCLTALTGLTRLEVFSEGFSKELGKKHLVLECQAASGLPVWQQLERRCTASMLRKQKKRQQQHHSTGPQRATSDHINGQNGSSGGFLARALSLSTLGGRLTNQPPPQTAPGSEVASWPQPEIESGPAGLTAVSAQEFCGDQSGKKAALLGRIAVLKQMLVELEAEVAAL